MITRTLVNRYLEHQLGVPLNSPQGLMYNCPICDGGGNKHNLEVNLDRKIFNCWSCRYSGTIRKLLQDRATDTSWEAVQEFRSHREEAEEVEKPIYFPTETVPIHLNQEVKEYLLSRGMNLKELARRGVRYVYSENETYHNHIYFPFYKEGRLAGACLQNFATKKYRNLGKFDFVPWEEYLNTSYPITVAEGAYDGLSGINSTILRGTELFKAMLEFLRGKDVILAVDNKFDIAHYTAMLKAIEAAEPRGLALFDLKEYDDMNAYYLSDPAGFFREYRECFNALKR